MKAITASRPTRGSPARLWLDLSAFLDPAGLGLPTPDLDPADWFPLYRFACNHLVAPQWAAMLERRGWPASIPDEARDALQALRLLNQERNRRLRDMLRDTTCLLNAAGIVPLPLKGAMALLPGQYPDAGERIMGDLDIAVAPDQMPAAIDALLGAGYHLPPNLHPYLWRNTGHHHAPALAEPTGYGYVELHRAIYHREPVLLALPLAAVLAEATRLDWEGVVLRIPSLKHRLIHNRLHHQFQDRAMFTDRRSLRSLLELARLRGMPEAARLYWPSLLAELDGHGAGDALRLDLLATQTLFGMPLPSGVWPSPTALALEGRFWWRLEHPRIHRGLDAWQDALKLGRRLRKLPDHVFDPYWYPALLWRIRYHWSSRCKGLAQTLSVP